MNAAELAHRLERRGSRLRARPRSARVRIIDSLGPLTILGGIAWAVAQPYRITLLHPGGQGFWWLFSEPPLYVIAVGLVFTFLVAPSLREDLAAAEDEEERSP